MTATVYLPTEQVVQLRIVFNPDYGVGEGERVIVFQSALENLRTGDCIYMLAILPGMAAEFVGTPEIRGDAIFSRVRVWRDWVVAS